MVTLACAIHSGGGGADQGGARGRTDTRGLKAGRSLGAWLRSFTVALGVLALAGYIIGVMGLFFWEVVRLASLGPA